MTPADFCLHIVQRWNIPRDAQKSNPTEKILRKLVLPYLNVFMGMAIKNILTHIACPRRSVSERSAIVSSAIIAEE